MAGAAVRSAARSRAERARGLRAISAAPGTTGLRFRRRKLGAARAPAAAGGASSRAAAAAARAQETLHPAVLERMERDDREPAAGHQQALGRREAAVELAQLVVDGDAQRLEGAGRGVDAAGAAGTAPRTSAASRRCG